MITAKQRRLLTVLAGESIPGAVSSPLHGPDPGYLSFTVFARQVGVNQMYRRGRGRGLYITPEGAEFKRQITSAAKMAVEKASRTNTDAPCCIYLRIWYPTRRFDVDAAVKPILDALQGVVYDNDRQVHRLVVVKCVDKEDPRTDIEVFGLEETP